MKKLFTSTLLTVAAVPFLMAAPAPKKAQNTSTDQAQTQTKTKTHKKHHKKAKNTKTAAEAK
jgi:hypothetical protein